MKKYFLPALAILVIGVFVMNSVFAPRMGGSPYVSQENAIEDLSGWKEDALDRTWTYVSANAGGNTFVVNVSGDVTDFARVTMRVRAKQGAGYQYFITHDVSAYDDINDRTTLTLFGGDHSVLTDAAITDVAFSMNPFPVGFSRNPDRWTVEFYTTSYFQKDLPNDSEWYDTGFSLDVPVGVWHISYDTVAWTSGGTQIKTTLSTTTNSEVDIQLSDGFSVGGATYVVKDVSAFNLYEITSETTFHLLILTSYVGATYIRTYEKVLIRALSAYY